MAAKRGFSYLVEYFIGKEADINITDNKGVSISLSDNTAKKKDSHFSLIPVYPGDNVINSLLVLIESKAVEFTNLIAAEFEDKYRSVINGNSYT